MYQKLFRSLEEQIDILRIKGLVINNEEKAKEVLLKENYFFISSYRYIFYTEDKKYIEGATFEELHALFLFDRELRNLLFKYLLVVENNIKSIVSYQLSKKYGYKESDYLNPENFTKNNEQRAQLNDVLRKMKRQIKVNTKQHKATLHYVNNYGYIPLWVLVKVLSFGIVAELFDILKQQDKEDICKVYGFDIEDMANYLSILSNYRNLCAHEDMVFENRTQRKVNNTEFHKSLNIPKNDEKEYIYGKDDLFALLIILKQMVNDREFRKIIDEIDMLVTDLFEKINSIPDRKILDKMGFPDNWREVRDL